jgi:beta-lactamase regulating signal transducer with metallopeptidase domain
LVHIKRGDHRVRMLELTVGILYWWLPIVGSIGRQLRACEEACCDEAVVTRLPEARRDYATLLLDVIDFTTPSRGQPPPQAATAMSAADGLEKRIRAILDATPGMRRSQLCWALVAGLTCAILPCELHYDFVGRPTRAAVAIEREPDAEPTDLPGDECEIKPAMSVCCPS